MILSMLSTFIYIYLHLRQKNSPTHHDGYALCGHREWDCLKANLIAVNIYILPLILSFAY